MRRRNVRVDWIRSGLEVHSRCSVGEPDTCSSLGDMMSLILGILVIIRSQKLYHSIVNMAHHSRFSSVSNACSFVYLNLPFVVSSLLHLSKWKHPMLLTLWFLITKKKYRAQMSFCFPAGIVSNLIFFYQEKRILVEFKNITPSFADFNFINTVDHWAW